MNRYGAISLMHTTVGKALNDNKLVLTTRINRLDKILEAITLLLIIRNISPNNTTAAVSQTTIFLTL